MFSNPKQAAQNKTAHNKPPQAVKSNGTNHAINVKNNTTTAVTNRPITMDSTL